MAAKIFALFALLAVSVSAATARPDILVPPPDAGINNINIPCVQYATVQQVLASGISPSSAVVLQRPLANLRYQCFRQQQIQQQQQQQQLAALLNLQQAQQQQLPFRYLSNIMATASPAFTYNIFRQQQQLVPYLFNNAVNAINAAAAYYGQQQQQQQLLNAFSAENPVVSYTAYGQQQLVPYLFNNAVNAINPAAAYYGQQQQLLNAFSAVNPAAAYTAYEQQQLVPYFFNAVAATNPAAFWQQPFPAGACF